MGSGVSVFGCRFSCFGSRVSCFVFGVWGSGLHRRGALRKRRQVREAEVPPDVQDVSCFVFRVSCFVFRVWGLGFGNWGGGWHRSCAPRQRRQVREAEVPPDVQHVRGLQVPVRYPDCVQPSEPPQQRLLWENSSYLRLIDG